MSKTTKLEKKIEEYCLSNIDSGFRRHLGASIIGRECARSIWYEFRWTKEANHGARVARLFNRGHREETVFADLLRQIEGIKLWSHDDNDEQFRIKGVYGHFGGSADGVCVGIPDSPKSKIVVEYKTHSDTSFKDLKKHGVKKSKYEHYVQVNMYAAGLNKAWFLYCAVNKNDDALFFEAGRVDELTVSRHLKRAEYIIFSNDPPPRISQTSTFFKCRMCRMHDVCWLDAAPAINCRTCVNSRPTTTGTWQCLKHTMCCLKDQKGCCDYESLFKQ